MKKEHLKVMCKPFQIFMIALLLSVPMSGNSYSPEKWGHRASMISAVSGILASAS